MLFIQFNRYCPQGGIRLQAVAYLHTAEIFHLPYLHFILKIKHILFNLGCKKELMKSLFFCLLHETIKYIFCDLFIWFIKVYHSFKTSVVLDHMQQKDYFVAFIWVFF